MRVGGHSERSERSQSTATLVLRTLATVMPPRNGRVYIDNIEISGERSARVVRDRIGYLPQDFGFDPRMTVTDFVTYAAWMRGVPSGQWRRSVAETLEMVDLTDRRRSRMRSLSGGMRRRAGIAWAIVGRPSLVLLDEPTVGLDPRQRLQIRKIISGLSDTVVVLSTHLTDAPAEMQEAWSQGRGIARWDSNLEQFQWAEDEASDLRGRYCQPGH